MKMHREIYKLWHGPILLDEEGRTYDIHHVDGNHANNHPLNLVALTINDHFDVHYVLEDWMACKAIAIRMKKSPEKIGELSSKAQNKRVAEGTHHWMGPENNKVRLEAGTHHFLGPNLNKKRLENGTHPWQNKEMAHRRNLKWIAEGTHPSQIKKTCPTCGKTMGKPMFIRWHQDKKCSKID